MQVLKAASRFALGRGIGGSRVWLSIGIAATGLRVLGRLVRKEPDVVYSEPLEPGQRLFITHFTRE